VYCYDTYLYLTYFGQPVIYSSLFLFSRIHRFCSLSSLVIVYKLIITTIISSFTSCDATKVRMLEAALLHLLTLALLLSLSSYSVS
jgi:hypothetical protein